MTQLQTDVTERGRPIVIKDSAFSLSRRTSDRVRSFCLPFVCTVSLGCLSCSSSGIETTANTNTSFEQQTTGTTPTTEAPSSTTIAVDCAAESDALFAQRIAPLLATDRPKTCNTCHLSGVDLEMFVQETPCQTMACLESKGLVSLADPASSVVLQWISRADPSSPLIDQQVIDEEYAGFLAWIEEAATCGLCYTGDAPCGTPTEANCPADDPANDVFEDPGDCSPVTRETLFRRNVYAWRDRCFPCHFDSSEFDAPKWIMTGPCDLASLGTMRTVFDRNLIDFDDPAASLLLLKPLAESAGGVEHGGGDKFHDLTDPAYLDIRNWIEREVACTP